MLFCDAVIFYACFKFFRFFNAPDRMCSPNSYIVHATYNRLISIRDFCKESDESGLACDNSYCAMQCYVRMNLFRLFPNGNVQLIAYEY